MPQQPLVSVVVPAYNSERFLPACLASLRRQKPAPHAKPASLHRQKPATPATSATPEPLDAPEPPELLEIVCVDDGSTDSTPDILAAAASADPRVRVITQANAGVSAARNTGLDASRGTYICFLDADDCFEPDMLSSMSSALERDGADICVCRGYELDMRTGERTVTRSSLRLERIPEKVPFTPREASAHLFDFTTFPCMSKMWRRSLITDSSIRHRPYRNCADVVFTSETLLAARLITVVDKPLYTYRMFAGGSLSESMSRNILTGFEALCEVRRILDERGEYDVYEQSFTNKALGHLLANAEKAADEDTFAVWYGRMVSGGFDELGITGRDASYFYKRADYDSLCAILAADGPASARAALHPDGSPFAGRPPASFPARQLARARSALGCARASLLWRLS